MPGPFQASLPALPSPTAGMQLGGNPLAAAAQAFSQFPQQEQEAKKFKLFEQQQKMQATEQQQKIEEQNYSRALQKLGLQYRIVAGDPTGTKAKDPNVINAINDAAKQAGLGPMTSVDPTTGAQMVDLNALKSVIASKLYSEVDPQTRMELDQADPAQRAGIYVRAGVDPSTVPQEGMNSPSYLSASQKEKVIKDFTAAIGKYSSGGMSIGGLQATLQAMGPELAQAGMTVDSIKQMIESPEFQSSMAPMVEAKIASLRAIGIKDAALAKYYKQKTIDEPKDLASKITYRNGMLSLGQERVDVTRDLGLQRIQVAADNAASHARQVDAYTQQVQNNIQKANTTAGLNALKISQTVLTKNLDPLTKERDGLMKQANDYIMNGKDIPDTLVQQIQQVQSTIDTATAALDTAGQAATQAANQNFSRAAGKPTRFVPWEPPHGYQEGTSNGKTVWLDPATGKIYDENGNYLGKKK